MIKSLVDDEVFRTFSLAERNKVRDRILSDIQGRMMEDIVLLETKMAFPKHEVFKLIFTCGEYDMVLFDPERATCEIYEVKHSDIIDAAQYQHLVDSQKCKDTKFRYGEIKGKYVIYRGESQIADGIQYENVEEYLKNLTGK